MSYTVCTNPRFQIVSFFSYHQLVWLTGFLAKLFGNRSRTSIFDESNQWDFKNQSNGYGIVKTPIKQQLDPLLPKFGIRHKKKHYLKSKNEVFFIKVTVKEWNTIIHNKCIRDIFDFHIIWINLCFVVILKTKPLVKNFTWR